MSSPQSRQHSEEITPPPPLQGTFIPRTGDLLRYPQRCDARQGLSNSPTVTIYLFHSPDLWWKTSGLLVDGQYSLLADHSIRNAIAWPLTPWTMYDVEQRRWVDIPTFARVDVWPNEFLMFRTKGSLDIDSDQFAAMDSLILKLQAQYKRFSSPIESEPAIQPAMSPATPIHPRPRGSIHCHAKRKRSEEHIAAAASSSPSRTSCRSTKQMRAEEQGV
ncbi:hypothetical protein HYPSUDRAFT_205164 [Hypholoma sublateritium FD-334 SS-4]|uniref:Uncharacterized protein n=1 Tax=Hypholoma sublateritium (strain FD-334 SS-4) TaxID=945553 RepID=A0A0D2PEM6_HYPSF|nr:hypothetical protein HYPSUDRAFT_205164 [Hypholoma sublateritium FD-334 SS-4]